MKIMWFTNTVMPDARGYLRRPALRGTGWWMPALLDRLKSRQDLRLAVVTVDGFTDAHFETEGVEYFVLRRPWRNAILSRLHSPRAILASRSQLARYASVVKQWNPDLVHVHGTEREYGLIRARGLTDKPLVVSLQGLVTPYLRKVFGELLPHELASPLRHRLSGLHGETLYRWKLFREQSEVEEEILRSADMVLGRTHWDYAWAWAFNPNVRYRHVNELMRPEFYQAAPWNRAKCRRHQIFCTSGDQSLKGLHVLLEAVWRLRRVYPDVKLAIASSGFVPRPRNDYARFVLHLIRKWGLLDAVTFLGLIDAGGIVQQLQLANCYVAPSFIENSCNALQEAMLLGTPSVSTLCGGLLTLVDSERTGLTCPTGDAAVLACQIHRVFNDDDLAVRIGAEARTIARERHDPRCVEDQLMAAYAELIEKAEPSGPAQRTVPLSTASG